MSFLAFPQPSKRQTNIQVSGEVHREVKKIVTMISQLP